MADYFNKISDKSKLILLVLLSGVIYSIFLHPMTTEHAEFGQSLAGLIETSAFNDFYLTRLNDPSLQVVLPALLLKLGMSSFTMSIAASILTQCVPFLALSLLIYSLSENIYLSFFSILIVLQTSSPLNHQYGLTFPADFFAFGNLANWIAVLCIALLLNQYKKSSAFLTGLMVSIHAAWALAAILYFVFFLIKEPKKSGFLRWFSCGVLISLLCLFAHPYMKQHFFQKSIYQTEAGQENLTKDSVQTPSLAFPMRTHLQMHNPFLFTGDWKTDLTEFATLLRFSVFTFLLSFLLWKNHLIPRYRIEMLIKPYGIIFLLVWIGLLFIEVTEHYQIWADLYMLDRRLIPNRYMNLSFIFYHVLLITALASLFFKSSNFIFKAILIFIAYKFARNPYERALEFMVFLFFAQYLERCLTAFCAKHMPRFNHWI